MLSTGEQEYFWSQSLSSVEKGVESEKPCLVGYLNWNLEKEWAESRHVFLKEFFFDFCFPFGIFSVIVLVFISESYTEKKIELSTVWERERIAAAMVLQ